MDYEMVPHNFQREKNLQAKASDFPFESKKKKLNPPESSISQSDNNIPSRGQIINEYQILAQKYINVNCLLF